MICPSILTAHSDRREYSAERICNINYYCPVKFKVRNDRLIG